MIREEAIDRLRKISEKTPIRTNGDDLVAITMAIQALSQEPTDENLHREREQAYMQGYEDASKRFRQEPCDDAISREDAINALANVPCYSGSIKSRMVGAIKGLPSVTQKSIEDMPCVTPEEMQKCKDIVEKYRPKGKWLDDDGIWFKCSECGAYRKMFHAYKEYYCPNCGAKMESEE